MNKGRAMTDEDIALSPEAIDVKYPSGSPEYPSHHKGCGCSGCWISWAEWRAAHHGYQVGRAQLQELVKGFARYLYDAIEIVRDLDSGMASEMEEEMRGDDEVTLALSRVADDRSRTSFVERR